MFKFIGFVFVAVVIFLPFKDGTSVSNAAKNKVIQQVPAAVEILAARHPLEVGLVHTLFNQHGEVDSLAKDYLQTQMDQQKSPGIFQSYALYYIVMFDKDDIRKSIADSIEKQLGL